MSTSTGSVFGETPRRPGKGREYVTSVKVGEELPVLDPWEVRKIRSLARIYGVRFTKTDTGMKRVA